MKITGGKIVKSDIKLEHGDLFSNVEFVECVIDDADIKHVNSLPWARGCFFKECKISTVEINQ